MKINKLKIGDIITRIEPIANGDRSYTGEKFKLFKIDNKYIYLKSFQNYWNSNEVVKLELNNWSDGWKYYIDNNKEKIIKDIFDRKKELELQAKKLVKELDKNEAIFIKDYKHYTGKIDNAKKNRDDNSKPLRNELFEIRKLLKD